MRRFQILIVDDDEKTCEFMTELLETPDREIRTIEDAAAALELLRQTAFDLVISDMHLNAPVTGLDLLRAFKAKNPAGQFLLISGFGSLDTAVGALRAGAFDYISKPFNLTEVKNAVERALATSVEAPGEAPPAGPIAAPGLIGCTPQMLSVYNQVARAAATDAPVLIVGESGTGKELVARAIHENSARAGRPLVAINCGAIAETLLESELFGHLRGAFTGAVADKKGIFEQGQGGTVFLDEIGETTPALQVKLLRVIEEGEVRPVGGSRALKVDIRILAATNTHLERAVAEQRFRPDLYYRLSVIVIALPPLRERGADIPLLVSHFLANACRRAGRRVELTPEAIEALVAHDWPGNVRELENLIERLVVFSRGPVADVADLPPALQGRRRDLQDSLFQDLPSIEELERRYLQHVLGAVGGNRSRAAEVLGIDRRTLYRMAERFGIPLPDD